MKTSTNKVTLVTGASSGIGKACAKNFAAQGYKVFAAARRVEKMDDLISMGIIPIKMDITKDEDIHSCVDKIKKDLGRIDVLVNNAGFATYGAVEDTSIDDARYQFEVNLFGLAGLTQLVLPMMRAQQYGKIINISSVGGKIYSPLGAWYHATKHALEGWSDALRLETAPFGIDVVIIEPGGIKTEFTDVMTKPMMDRSGNTPYGNLARSIESYIKKEWESGKASDPSVISAVVVKSAMAKKPKTRYFAGRNARLVLTLRRWLSDRAFDKQLMRLVK